jgi:DNA-binding beta-propeller fold protein YncE
MHDTNEIAWLARSLAVVANRERNILRMTSDPRHDGLLQLQQAAVRIFTARVTQVFAHRGGVGRRLAKALRHTPADLRVTRRARRQALHRFLRLAAVRTVRKQFAADGLGSVVMPTLRRAVQSVSEHDVPRSLSDLFARSGSLPASPDALLHPTGVEDRGLTPTAAFALRAALLNSGEDDGDVPQLCGDHYGDFVASQREASFRNNATMEGDLLYDLLWQAAPDQRPCAPQLAPTITPIPLDGADPGPHSVLLDEADTPDTGKDVAVGPDGELFIADAAAQVVRRYGPNGEPRGVIGGPDAADGGFVTPVGVAVAADGHVFVSDFDADRVDRFSADGHFERSWGSTGSGPGQFRHPTGVAIAPNGDVIVVDEVNERLERFAPDGTLMSVIQAPAAPAAGHLYLPRGIAIAPDGTIAVADKDGARVVLFSPNGSVVGETAPSDSSGDPSPIGLYEPYDVAFDRLGRIWVADQAGGQLVRLDSLDRVGTRITSLGPAPADVLTPIAVTVRGDELLTLDGASGELFASPVR